MICTSNSFIENNILAQKTGLTTSGAFASRTFMHRLRHTKETVRDNGAMTPYKPPDQPLKTVYVDDDLLVLNKPGGLLSVPGRGAEKHDCLASRVQEAYPDALIVHRLDMETSGLIVLARGSDMQRRLGMLFQERKVEKRYIAVVHGQPEADCGSIDLPLIVDWPNRPRQKVDHERGKASLTHYRVLERDAPSNSSLIELQPVTGRSHQLRVHLAALGHPILGDPLYATGEARAKAERLLLHAAYLAFAHPANARPLSFALAPEFHLPEKG